MRLRTALLSVGVILGVAAGATVALPALSGSGSAESKLAVHLLARDPGALTGANTIVSTDDDGEVLSVLHRPNFVLALGDHETVHDGTEDNQIGALGDGDTIVVHGKHELVIGGPHGKVIVGGPGHDLVIERYPDATIVLDSPHNEVIVSGRDDRVECLDEAADEEIHAGPSDAVAKSCHGHRNVELSIERPRVAALASDGGTALCANPSNTGLGRDPHPCPVLGGGSNASPYTVNPPACPFDNEDGEINQCTVEFPARGLNGLWDNEHVPAYRCPQVTPYLNDLDLAPSGTSLPRGVQVLGLGPIGVSISGTSTVVVPRRGVARTGTLTGFPHSSATNWNGGSHSYRLILHCSYVYYPRAR